MNCLGLWKSSNPISAWFWRGPASQAARNQLANFGGTKPTLSGCISSDVPGRFARQKSILSATLCAAAALCLGLTAGAHGQVRMVPSITTVAGNGTGGYSGDGGPATSAELGDPYGVAVDSTGNIYIGDCGNNVVREVVAKTGIIKTFAGNGTWGLSGDGGPATSAELRCPYGLAVDSAGNLYIADYNNNRIREVVAATGVIETVAGSNGTLNEPQSVAVDAAGNLYIAESAVRLVAEAVAGGTVNIIAGTGADGYSGDGGPATNAKLDSPASVAVDNSGNVYIADDGNNCIREISAATGIIETVAGNGVAGYSGDGGPATSAELNGPSGVKVDSAGNLYIADRKNDRIREVVAATGTIETIAGNGAAGDGVDVGDGGPATSAEIGLPENVALDSAGNLYIADIGDEAIREVSAPTKFPDTAVGDSSTVQNIALELVSAQTVSSIAAAASLGNKQEYALGAISGCTVDGVTVNPAGTVCTIPITFKPAWPGVRGAPLTVQAGSGTYKFVLTGIGTGPLVAFTPGIISTFAGDGAAGYRGDGGAATSAELSNPIDVAVDYAGNVYIADYVNSVVREVVAATGTIKTIAGNGTAGFSGDGGPATSAELNEPQGVAVDSVGNVYIADTFNNRIREIVAATGSIKTIAGNGTAGFSGDGGPATSAELRAPNAVAVDGNGNIYIVDGENDRLREVAAGTGTIRTVAGNGTYGYSGDGGPAAGAELNGPGGAAVDNAGNIYIADTHNSRIRKVTAATGIIETVAGNGTAGDSGDGGTAASAELGLPSDVALDSAGNIYIADQSYSIIREVLAAKGTIETIAGNGNQGYSGDGGAATSAKLRTPTGVAVDSAGNVYIAGYENNIVRSIDVGQSALSFADTAVNSGNSSDSPRIVTVQNAGNSTLTFPLPSTGSNPSVSANFTWDNSSTCDQTNPGSATAFTLAEGASCDIGIDFAPNTAGDISGSVALTDDSLNASPAVTQSVSLSGTGESLQLLVTTSSLPGATLGAAYSQTLAASGGVSPYTWSIASGSLPPGLKLDAHTGAITGTPTTAGPFDFEVQAADAEATPAMATANLSIVVTAPAQFLVATSSLPGATLGAAYSQTLAVTGGVPPYTWSIISGSLPKGLALNANSGAITGTPTDQGLSNFTVKVSDAESTPQTASADLSISVNAPVVTPTTTTLAVSSGGKTVTTVAVQSLVTLTASVSSSVSAKAGFVTFCDADVDGCAGAGVVGIAQLNGTGTAILRFYPPTGKHSYKAMFAATRSLLASASDAEDLSVTGISQTKLSFSGSVGNYSLTATVGGFGNFPPSGSVSFIDIADQFSLGTAALRSAGMGFSLGEGGSAATGTDPDFVVAADFNGDGKTDLAVANDPELVAGSGPGVTILLGNGEGAFTAAPSFFTGSVYGLAVADFNGDGKADLAISSDANSITILLGNGDGTFTSAGTAPTGTGPSAIVTGDFNNDGNADLAVANSGNVSILLGDGDGSFTAGTPVSIAGDYIVVADFNGDGKADLAITTDSNAAQIFLGNGDGTFTSGANLPLSGAVDSAPGDAIAVGDFNGDGVPDLAIESQADSSQAVVVDVFLNRGNGAFTAKPAAVTVNGDTNAYSIAAADFNGDGKTDLLLSDDQEVGIFLSNGDGSFSTSVTAPGAASSPNWNSVAIGDFDGNGIPDVVVVNSDLQTAVTLLPQPYVPASATLTGVAIPGSGTHNVEAIYAGTALQGASRSSPIALSGSQLPTSLALTSNLTSAAYGQQLTLTATLAPYLDQNLATDGETVTFLNNGANIGTGTLSAGVAALNVDSLPSGTDTITATYAGDSNFAAATAKAISIVVAAQAPAVTVSPGSLTFASQAVGSTSAAQIVTLTNPGAAALAISSISASGDFAESQSCGTSLAAGANCKISVTFTPTTSGSRTGTLAIADNASGSPQTVALSGNGSSVSITPPSGNSGLSISSPGGTATIMIEIGSAGGFSGTVNLTCSVAYTGTGTPNDPPTCTVKPSQETITAGGSANVTLTVNTTAENTSMLRSLGGGASLAAFAILIFVPRKRRRGLMMLLVLGLVTAMACTACGGGGSGSTSSGNQNSGTTAGSYNVNVTATSGSNKATATIPLAVQ